MTWEVDGIRQRGRPKKTLWNSVKDNMESLGLSQKEANDNVTLTLIKLSDGQCCWWTDGNSHKPRAELRSLRAL